MSIYLPSSGGKDPFWGPQTSHMNFCEEDYHVTSYIGEFINTLTSLFYAYLGCSGLVGVSSRGERGLITRLPYYAIIVLGICSALFHASLKYHMQLLDDNSMLFGAAVIMHRLLTRDSSRNHSLILAAAITGGVCLAIWAHIELGESTLHQIVFAGMMLTNAYNTHRLIGITVRNQAARKQMHVAGIMALFLFISGYILWNIDNIACQRLRATRNTIGLPWAWLLELHGWWHVLTGLAVHVHTMMIECLCPVGQTQPRSLEQRIPGFAYFGLKTHSKKA